MVSAMDNADPPFLPSSLAPIYLAEGAAHILYRLQQSPPSPPTDSHTESFSRTTPPPSSISPPTSPSQSHTSTSIPSPTTHLLRLRKTSVPYPPVQDSHRQFLESVAPLLSPENLVQQTLVRLPEGSVGSLNVALKEREARGERPERRRGEYLDEGEEMGLLVTDMTPDTKMGEVGVEFKVKWLVQSPTAPTASVRCRTCALRAMRLSQAKEDHRPYCPLKLVSGRLDLVEDVVRSVLHSESATTQMIERVTIFLYKCELLPRLRKLQRDLDPKGILDGEVDENFLIAMALRDCTLFLKVPAETTGSIEARLSDLDIKPASEQKLKHWRGTELRLIGEDWYTRTSLPGTNGNDCVLRLSSV